MIIGILSYYTWNILYSTVEEELPSMYIKILNHLPEKKNENYNLNEIWNSIFLSLLKTDLH